MMRSIVLLCMVLLLGESWGLVKHFLTPREGNLIGDLGYEYGPMVQKRGLPIEEPGIPSRQHPNRPAPAPPRGPRPSTSGPLTQAALHTGFGAALFVQSVSNVVLGFPTQPGTGHPDYSNRRFRAAMQDAAYIALNNARRNGQGAVFQVGVAGSPGWFASFSIVIADPFDG
jgi:hypothetical protein